MIEKPHFSLAIKKSSKEALDQLTAQYKLNQSEVIEVLLDAAVDPLNVLTNELHEILFMHKYEEKEKGRDVVRNKKSELRKAILKIAPAEMEEILKQKGLLND